MLVVRNSAADMLRTEFTLANCQNLLLASGCRRNSCQCCQVVAPHGSLLPGRWWCCHCGAQAGGAAKGHRLKAQPVCVHWDCPVLRFPCVPVVSFMMQVGQPRSGGKDSSVGLWGFADGG